MLPLWALLAACESASKLDAVQTLREVRKFEVGEAFRLRHVEEMNGDNPPGQTALAIAEDVLRAIYGDDLLGCNVTLKEIAAVIERRIEQRAEPELLNLYEKLVEAIHLLSTPPDRSKVTDPVELQALLGQRLDAIQTLTRKAIATTATYKKARAESDEP